MQQIRVIDSHTGGEPTRIVVDGAPDLGAGPLAERVQRFEHEFDWFRSATVCEPRGSDAVVGGLLCESTRDDCVAAVIFYNNVGYLNMCVHGTIGLGVTLGHLGRIEPDIEYQIETPVGLVSIRWEATNHVTVRNVFSYRSAHNVELQLDDGTRVNGDVAWGGNWFFLVDNHGQQIEYSNREQLQLFARSIRRALERDGVTGDDGGQIDHIELFAPTENPDSDSKNFVLCPGGEYDRSPCGTGTSAKLACLHAAGKLSPGETWHQEGIVGSVFEGSIEPLDPGVIPQIRGTAFVTADAQLLLDPRDRFQHGIDAT